MELLSMPAEIIASIMEFVTVSELFSLHLVSKAISSLTYEYFQGEVINSGMAESERAKYKRINHKEVPIDCRGIDCDNTTGGPIFCPSCIKTKSGFEYVHPVEFHCVDGAILPAYAIDCARIGLVLVKEKGLLVRKGSILEHDRRVKALTPHEEEYFDPCYRYEFPGEGTYISYKKCNHTKLIAKSPLVVHRCCKVLDYNSVSGPHPDFCEAHNKAPEGHVSEFELPEKVLVVEAITEETGDYSIIEGELECEELSIVDGVVSAIGIKRGLCEKYGITFARVTVGENNEGHECWISDCETCGEEESEEEEEESEEEEEED